MKQVLAAVVLAIVLAGIPTNAEPCTPFDENDNCLDACGNIGSELARFKDVPAFSNGGWTGSGCGPWQCVNYVRRFYSHEINKALGALSPAYAVEAFADWPANSGLTAYVNGQSTTPPAVGDIYCQSGNTYGHMGIIKEVNLTGTPMTVTIIDQNRSSASATLIRTVTKDSQNRYSITDLDGDPNSGSWTTQGWLRDPNYNPPPPPVSHLCEYYSQSPASLSLFPGQSATVSATFTNVGTSTWKGAGTGDSDPAYMELRTCGEWPTGTPQDGWLYPGSGWISASRVVTATQATIPPNQGAASRATFTFTVKVPLNQPIGPDQRAYFRPWHKTGGFINDWAGFYVPVNVLSNRRLDFDGDGVSDVWNRTAAGYFRLDYARDNLDGWDYSYGGYGGSSDTPAPADYDGDGKWDFAVLWNADRTWRIDYASDGFGSFAQPYLGGYGDAADYPCPCDYDGDRKADISVRDADGDWHIDYAANGFGAWDWTGYGYGGANDRPAPADFDGDGKCDFAVLRNSDRKFLIDYAGVTYQGQPFGSWDEAGLGGYGDIGDYPCPGDFDGDGKADIAVLWTDDGSFRFDHSSGGFGAWAYILEGYGGTGDRPMAGDFDGDGRDDIGVYHASVSRVCFDFWNYQGNIGWGDWDYCDAGGYHSPSRAQPAGPDDGTATAVFSLIVVNPATSSVNLRFALPEADRVGITIFDVRGRAVMRFPERAYGVGEHQLSWDRHTSDSQRVAPGIYFIRFDSHLHPATRKVVVIN